MNFKKILYNSIIASVILVTSGAPVLAETSVSVDSATEGKASTAIADFRRAATEVIKISNLKKAGDNMIEARLNLLNKVITRIKAATTLDAQTKSDLVASVQVQVSDLQDIKSKLDSETTLDAIKTDIKSIFSGHFIYGLFVPQIHSAIAADRLMAAITKLTDLKPKIESFLSQLKSNGTDTTAGDTAYTDFKTQLEKATNSVNDAMTKVKLMSLTDYAAGRTAVAATKADLNAAKQALTKAKTDLETISSLAK